MGASDQREAPPGTNHPVFEHSGDGKAFHCSPTLSAARKSIAVSSGSDLGNATFPEGGNAAESSSPEPSSSLNAVIDILSSAGAPNETLGSSLEGTAASPRNSTGCDSLEEREAHRDFLGGEALTVTLRPPLPDAEVYLPFFEEEVLEQGMARGDSPRLM